jgi:hypothetical protein
VTALEKKYMVYTDNFSFSSSFRMRDQILACKGIGKIVVLWKFSYTSMVCLVSQYCDFYKGVMGEIKYVVINF